MSLIPHGWSAADLNKSRAGVAQNNIWSTSGYIYDLAYNLQTDIPIVHAGQVDFDMTAETDRTAEAYLLDPGREFDDLLNPRVALRHIVQIRHTTTYADGTSLTLPIATVRPVEPANDGLMWQIHGLGMESLLLNHRPGQSYKKGRFLVAAFKDWLDAAGYTRYVLPSTSVLQAQLGEILKVGGPNESRRGWLVFKKMFARRGWQLLMDSGGWVRLRRIPSKTQISFTFGTDHVLTALPLRESDLSDLHNRWIGQGVDSLDGDITARGPFSPDNLAVGSPAKPWFDTTYAGQDTSLTTRDEVEAAAKKSLERTTDIATSVSFDAIPVQTLNPGDRIALAVPVLAATPRLRQASIPFASDAPQGTGEGWPMSVNYLKTVHPTHRFNVRHLTGHAKPHHRRHHR